jgi:hypothetical protein
MALNLPTSMGAQLATDAERFSAFWEARRKRAPGLRDQLARREAPELPAFSTSALVDPSGDPI